MSDNNDIETIINKEYDYSNSIIDEKSIEYLVSYCESVYNQFNNLINEDEKRNEKLKHEFKNYNYKNTYTKNYEIRIREKEHSTTRLKNYETFCEYIKTKKRNIEQLEIELNLNYKRGTNLSYKEHENIFKISFKPYDIKFTRKSNYNEQIMNQVEENINKNSILITSSKYHFLF